MCVHSLSKTILRLEFIILQHIKIRFITIDGQSYTIFHQIKKETSINKRFYINKIKKKSCHFVLKCLHFPTNNVVELSLFCVPFGPVMGLIN